MGAFHSLWQADERRESQANVLSTIHRHLSTWNALGRIFSHSTSIPSFTQTPRKPLHGCSTICTSQPSVSFTHWTKPPLLYPLSAQISSRRGKFSLSGSSRSLPPW